MKKFAKICLAFVLSFVIVASGLGVQGASAKGTKSVGKPKISIKAEDNTIKVTIKKTADAEGYYIYLKGEDYKKFMKVGMVEKDGTAKRTYTIPNLVDGSYSVRVKGYAGDTVSKASSTKKATVKSTTQRNIRVLFTSDVHCGIDQGFTYVGLKAVKDNLIANGYQVLLVDDGDSIQGEPIGTLTNGVAIIDIMNAIGYDVAIPGNHEFDYGVDNFLNLVNKANYPYISSNFNKEGELILKPYVIKEIGGVKIAFVGVTTPETLVTSTPRYFQDENGEFIYGFMQDSDGSGVYNAVQSAVDAARSEGAAFVVAMGHLGNESECEPWTYADVITNTNGIDVFLDGHSHDTDKVVVKNKDGKDVIRQACGTKLANIGWVDINLSELSIDTGLFTWTDSTYTPVGMFGLKNEMSEILENALGVLKEELNEVVATSEYVLTIYDPEAKDDSGNPIRIVRCAETNLGDLCADAYRDQSGADIAIVNGGGIRVNIASGNITKNDVLKVHPFGNMLSVIEVTGQQILDALEWGCRSVPTSIGGFPQVSGISFEIHTYIDSTCTQDENGMYTGITGARRVQNVMVGDEPIDPKKTYTLASTDYIIQNNGDGYTMFDGAKVLQNAVKLDNQVLMDYIAGTLKGVVGEEYSNPYGEGRIVAVDKK